MQPYHSLMRLPTIAVAMLVVLSTVVGPGLAQVPRQDYLARPAPGAEKSDTGDYFVISAARGATVRQMLEIKNVSDVPITLSLAPVDARTASSGDVEYARTSEPRAQVGAWIDIEASEVQIEGGETTRVRFTVGVPNDARRGVNLGAIVLQSPDSSGTEQEIQNRTVIAVEVDTPGKRVPKVAVVGVKAEARTDGMYFDVGLANNGTGYASGSGTLLITEEVFEGAIEFDTFVPGTAFNYPIRWTTAPEPGTYSVQVLIEYADGQPIEWSGEVDVSARLVAELADLRGTEDGEGSGGIGSLPVIAAVAVAALIGSALLFGRRGKSGPATVPADGPSQDAEAPMGAPATAEEGAASTINDREAGAEPSPSEPATGSVLETESESSSPTDRIAGKGVAEDLGRAEEPVSAEDGTTAERQNRAGTANGTPKKTTAKKPTGKKRTVTKTTTRKQAAKKQSARKATAKKHTQTAKKSTEKKTPAKKTARKKTATEDGTGSPHTEGPPNEKDDPD